LRASLLMHQALQFIATLSKTKRLINPLSQKKNIMECKGQSSKSDIRTQQTGHAIIPYVCFSFPLNFLGLLDPLIRLYRKVVPKRRSITVNKCSLTSRKSEDLISFTRRASLSCNCISGRKLRKRREEERREEGEKEEEEEAAAEEEDEEEE